VEESLEISEESLELGENMGDSGIRSVSVDGRGGAKSGRWLVGDLTNGTFSLICGLVYSFRFGEDPGKSMLQSGHS